MRAFRRCLASIALSSFEAHVIVLNWSVAHSHIALGSIVRRRRRRHLTSIIISEFMNEP